ncbi:MAG: amidohydrolase family protein, partial [Duncaniella sp.]|nr:amidohydrolase family protein [Duncaniella sp.]
PRLTDKAHMTTESPAALAGGVTSFVDMPNTKPATVSMDAVEDKLARAAQVSAINYGFFIGATNDNIDTLLTADYSRTAGIKLFLGSSTGNMLVDDDNTLVTLFDRAPALIAVHAEDEAIIRAARERLSAEYPDGIPVEMHPDVRPREACIAATRHAINLAERSGARVHICHISTAEELRLIAEAKARGVKVTAETCPQYLMFDRNDFLRLGARIKCNPAIKEPSDRIALLRQLRPGGVIDTIATDHAPHLPEQKQGNALTAASGMPMVQFSLTAMLDLMSSDPEAEGVDIARIVRLMCHAPASLLGIDRRGYLREGYYADLAIVRPLPMPGHRVTDSEVVSRCGWTPLDGRTLGWEVVDTIVNGGTGPRPLAFIRQ